MDEVFNGTLESVKLAVIRLFKDRKPDDLVLLYYSGHGLLDRNRLYFATAATNLDYPDVHSLEASYVKKHMDDSRSQCQVLILDCCHSGAFAEGKKAGEVKAVTDDTFASQGRGRFIMTASAAQQLAWEGHTLREGDEEVAAKNSVFTHFLVEGLASGEASNEDFVTVQQWYDFVHPRVVEAQPKMTPHYFVDQGAGQLRIARNAIPPLPREPLEALGSADIFPRLGAVAELKHLIDGADTRLAAAARGALTDRLAKEEHFRVRDAIQEVLEPADTTARRNKIAAERKIIEDALEDTRKDFQEIKVARDREALQRRNAEDALEDTRRELQEAKDALDHAAHRKAKADNLVKNVAAAAVISVVLVGIGTWAWLQYDRDVAAKNLALVEEKLAAAETRVAAAETERSAAETRAASAGKDLTAAADKAATLERELGTVRKELVASLGKLAEKSRELAESQRKFEDLEKQLSRSQDITKPVAGEGFRDKLKDGSDCSYCPEMVVIPAGSFMMGSPTSESERYADEGPRHRVRIPRAFALAKYEVTFAEWDACVQAGGCSHRPKDRGWGRGNRPVINVSWDDANEYVRWLSPQTGETYRLPSEAEWEYAARAGTTSRYHWGDSVGQGNANCDGCGSRWDNSQTAPVGSFSANRFGLYDMSGNVWEWVEDCWNRSYGGAPTNGRAWTNGQCSARVLRGGSWGSKPRGVGAALRGRNATGIRYVGIGFRVARTLP